MVSGKHTYHTPCALHFSIFTPFLLIFFSYSSHRNGSVIVDYQLTFLMPEENQDQLRNFTLSREMVYNVFRQFLYDQEAESAPTYIDPVSLIMFLGHWRQHVPKQTLICAAYDFSVSCVNFPHVCRNASYDAQEATWPQLRQRQSRLQLMHAWVHCGFCLNRLLLIQTNQQTVQDSSSKMDSYKSILTKKAGLCWAYAEIVLCISVPCITASLSSVDWSVTPVIIYIHLLIVTVINAWPFVQNLWLNMFVFLM